MLQAMRVFRLAAWRRFVAVLFVASAGIFASEWLAMELHDGDRAGSGSAVTAQASGVAAHVEDVAPDHAPHPGGGVPAHSFHVCHCAHAHEISLREAVSVPLAIAIAAPVRTGSVSLPSSHDVEPSLRPPIA